MGTGVIRRWIRQRSRRSPLYISKSYNIDLLGFPLSNLRLAIHPEVLAVVADRKERSPFDETNATEDKSDTPLLNVEVGAAMANTTNSKTITTRNENTFRKKTSFYFVSKASSTRSSRNDVCQ
jgi:hypothetical protein